MTRLVCATHGHCFDGLASAALLTAALRQRTPGVKVEYLACSYGPENRALPLDGDENALLDFRYEIAANLTYYIDHHATAFKSESERAHFETIARNQSAESVGRYVWDPGAPSCAGLVARVARERFEIDLDPEHASLIHWADKIDAAQFNSAEEASDRTNPVLRLASVVERFGDSDFFSRAVPIAVDEGLDGLSEARFVKEDFRRLAGRFRDYERRVRSNGRTLGRVALIDLSDKPVKVVSKFYQYRSFPDSLYSVVVANLGTGFKISVGFNPWQGSPLDVNIGALCAQYGGGGHAVVGAVNFGMGQGARAHEVAGFIAQELQHPASEQIP